MMKLEDARGSTHPPAQPRKGQKYHSRGDLAARAARVVEQRPHRGTHPCSAVEELSRRGVLRERGAPAERQRFRQRRAELPPVAKRNAPARLGKNPDGELLPCEP